MQRLLATMITTTSYGTWLPGDLRGYVDRGVILPGDPKLLDRSRELMSGAPVYFSAAEQQRLLDALVCASEQYGYRLIAVSIEAWHLHWLIDHRMDRVAAMAGRLKTAMRKALDRGRIWTAGYDKRYCFTEQQVLARVEYIKRHNGYRPNPGDDL